MFEKNLFNHVLINILAGALSVGVCLLAFSSGCFRLFACFSGFFPAGSACVSLAGVFLLVFFSGVVFCCLFC